MAKNYINDGNTIEFVAGADITSGKGIVIGTLVAVALGDVAEGDTGVGLTSGVFELPKASGEITQGAVVNIKPGTGVINVGAGATGDLLNCGVAYAAAASGDTTVLVKINAAGGASIK